MNHTQNSAAPSTEGDCINGCDFPFAVTPPIMPCGHCEECHIDLTEGDRITLGCLDADSPLMLPVSKAPDADGETGLLAMTDDEWLTSIVDDTEAFDHLFERDDPALTAMVLTAARKALESDSTAFSGMFRF